MKKFVKYEHVNSYRYYLFSLSLFLSFHDILYIITYFQHCCRCSHQCIRRVHTIIPAGTGISMCRNCRVIYELFGCGCECAPLRLVPFSSISPLVNRYYSRDATCNSTILEKSYFRLKTIVMQLRLAIKRANNFVEIQRKFNYGRCEYSRKLHNYLDNMVKSKIFNV